MSRLARFVIFACLLALAGTQAIAGSYTFTLTDLLGQKNTSTTSYVLDTGMRFTQVQSYTVHVKGATLADRANTAYTLGIHFGYPFDGYPVSGTLLSKGDCYNLTPFDLTYTWVMGSSTGVDRILEKYCRGKVEYSSYLAVNNTGYDTSGWIRGDVATITLNGTPVPEPASVLSLLCGIGGVGMMWRRRR